MLTVPGMDTPVISFILQLYLAVIQKMVAFSLAFVNNAVIEILQNVFGISLYDENGNKMSDVKSDDKQSSWVSKVNLQTIVFLTIAIVTIYDEIRTLKEQELVVTFNPQNL